MNNRFENFTVLISKINRNIKKIKNNEMYEYNLKSAHISILYFLYINQSLTAKELCDKCEEDKGSISRALDFLEKNKYIICNSKYNKRYNSPFKLTDNGIIIAKKIDEKIEVILSKINDCLNKNERVMFYTYLTNISKELEIICNNEKEIKND